MQAVGVPADHLKYREHWMSPANTANLSEGDAKERIHSVIQRLDNTFELPDTAEGIETLTHLRTDEDQNSILAWLNTAVQHGQAQSIGWATPPPASAQATADAWYQVCMRQHAHARPAASQLSTPGTPSLRSPGCSCAQLSGGPAELDHVRRFVYS